MLADVIDINKFHGLNALRAGKSNLVHSGGKKTLLIYNPEAPINSSEVKGL